ncbi:OTU domain-containing protein 7A-like [Hydractinia symbiolongicarpus]|uniref:OTU domain-containing protein 7A-like n=1 Tax=Hydractinia symbiolongicarpus TaxID=13093 RepID=UPI00254EF31F|nr:OTU domain-containing protein 7A-like [Hydractinia symbiolongicarpus]
MELFIDYVGCRNINASCSYFLFMLSYFICKLTFSFRLELRVTPCDSTMLSDNPKLQRERSREDLVRKLASETGIEETLAREYLASNNWNLAAAIRGYNDLLEAEKHRRERKVGTLRQVGRGFSVSNMELVQKAREQLSIEENEREDGSQFEMFDESARKNFVLPDISQFSRELANFIKNDLISINTLQTLTSADYLNWWADIGACRKLFPLSTVGDGNCLLHAASLGMWGFHDRLLTLRKSLHQFMLHPLAKKALKRRWKYNLWQENLKCGGLTYSHSEWEEEWNAVVKLTSDRPRRFEGGMPRRRISRQLSFRTSVEIGGAVPNLREGESLDSLESIHVYALANLLCRPIIIIAEEMLKDGAGNDVVPIPFGGIYLPLEKNPDVCLKYPLVLAYDASHFSALVPADGEMYNKGEKLSNSIPLMNRHLQLLPLRFYIEPGSTWDLVQDDSVKEEINELSFEEKVNLLRRYLDVVKVRFDKQGDSQPEYERNNSVNKGLSKINEMFVHQAKLLACKLNLSERPKQYKEMIENYIQATKQRFLEASQEQIKCATKGCRYAASPDYLDLCVECYDRIYQTNKVPQLRSSPPLDNGQKPVSDALVNRSASLHDIKVNLDSQENQVSRDSATIENNISRERVIPISDMRTFSALEGRRMVRSCRVNGCRFYGSEETEGFCSGCYRQIKYGGS